MSYKNTLTKIAIATAIAAASFSTFAAPVTSASGVVSINVGGQVFFTGAGVTSFTDTGVTFSDSNLTSSSQTIPVNNFDAETTFASNNLTITASGVTAVACTPSSSGTDCYKMVNGSNNIPFSISYKSCGASATTQQFKSSASNQITVVNTQATPAACDTTPGELSLTRQQLDTTPEAGDYTATVQLAIASA